MEFPDQTDPTPPNSEGRRKSAFSINPNLKKRYPKKQERSVEEYIKAIRNGDRIVLGQAITLIESKHPRHQSLAQEIIEKCLPFAGNSFRLGITGTPGVGKSTFIEALGIYLCGQDKKPAVLAIDPSSQKSKGSILGDKTRMPRLSAHPSAFIRPSPAGSSLGGVARKTRETIVLCEAAGFDTIIVETVGVGQSEIAVHSMVDFFLLLILPGAGDELQGIKRGIVEMADLIAVNKADGERKALAKQAQRNYRNAIHLLPPTQSGWIPKVLTCSAQEEEGIDTIWSASEEFLRLATANGFLEKNRQDQARFWLHQSIQNGVMQRLNQDEKTRQFLKDIEQQILKGKITPFKGAEQVLQYLLK